MKGKFQWVATVLQCCDMSFPRTEGCYNINKTDLSCSDFELHTGMISLSLGLSDNLFIPLSPPHLLIVL